PGAARDHPRPGDQAAPAAGQVLRLRGGPLGRGAGHAATRRGGEREGALPDRGSDVRGLNEARPRQPPYSRKGGLAMSFISRGFRGRREPAEDSSRLPPGQYLVRDFPVLSAGPTPHTPLDQWSFKITGAVDADKTWSWEEFRKLPTETVTKDIHCVTKWTKLDTTWTGAPVSALLE